MTNVPRMTDPERLCRCPACNPMHHGKTMTKRVTRTAPCALCSSTRRVTVAVAEKYMGAMTGMTASRTTGAAKPNVGVDVARSIGPNEARDRNGGNWSDRS